MLEIKDGDIFESGAEALVNPVNCIGIMGGGLAYVFGKRYPVNYGEYIEACKNKDLDIGKVFICKEDPESEWIINLPTMFYPGSLANLKDIEAGLGAMINAIQKYDIKSVAVPALGCGIGRAN